MAVAALKVPPAAVNRPLSVIPPVVAVAVNAPPTVEAPKFKLEDEIAAAPALFNTTTPPRVLEEVDRSIVLADVKLLPLASANTPLSVIAPVVEVAVNGPPTVEAPKFSVPANMVAAPDPEVLKETAPVNRLPLVPKVMAWLAAEVVKLPVVAEIAPLWVMLPVSEISVMLPGTTVAGITIEATSRSPKLPAAPVKVNVAFGNTLGCVAKLMLPADVK